MSETALRLPQFEHEHEEDKDSRLRPYAIKKPVLRKNNFLAKHRSEISLISHYWLISCCQAFSRYHHRTVVLQIPNHP
jgi:hypothetical protein